MTAEPASFRDPSAAVFYDGDRVLRGLDARAAADWSALRREPHVRRPSPPTAGSSAPASPTSTASTLPHDYALVLEHERDPVHLVSVRVDVRDAPRRRGAAPRTARERARRGPDDEGRLLVQRAVARQRAARSSTSARSSVGAGGPWVGLPPVLPDVPLSADARSAPRASRSSATSSATSTASSPTEMRRIFGGRRRFKKGVFRHVYLHSVAEIPRERGQREDARRPRQGRLRRRAPEGGRPQAVEARALRCVRSAPTPRGRSTARRARTATRTASPRSSSSTRCSTADRRRSPGTSARTTACTRGSSRTTARTSSPSTPTTSPSTRCTGRCAPTASTTCCRW